MSVKEKLDKQRAAYRKYNNRRRQDPDIVKRENERKLAHYHEVKKPMLKQVKEPVQSVPCPCCKQPVTVPTLEIVCDHYTLTPLEARILGAIWRGKGLPVKTERIFDAMYIDDPNGGPSPNRMYSAFKVALCHLRDRLEGSGISIENTGYRMGYRLVLGGK